MSLSYSFRLGDIWLRHVSLDEAITAAKATGMPLTIGWGHLPVSDILIPEMLIHSPIYVGDCGVIFAERIS